MDRIYESKYRTKKIGYSSKKSIKFGSLLKFKTENIGISGVLKFVAKITN